MTTLVSNKYMKGEYAGHTVQMPFIGEVKFEKDGTLILEGLSDEQVAEFIAATVDSFDFYIQGQQSLAPKTITVGGHGKGTTKVVLTPELLALKEGLDEATQEELLLLAAESKIEDPASMTAGKLKKKLLEIAIEATATSTVTGK